MERRRFCRYFLIFVSFAKTRSENLETETENCAKSDARRFFDKFFSQVSVHVKLVREKRPDKQ
jgi:hypothetical protein